MTVLCGIDWAERHHDIVLVDDPGTLLAKARITEDAVGYNQLLDFLAEHGDITDPPIRVAIEISHGLLVAALRSGNRKVFAINAPAAAHYCDRHGVSRKKSDPGGALVLANILHTDMHAHRLLPADSELAQAITVLARAQQDAVWSRQQVANQVRSLLREYYPAALHAFQGKEGNLTRPDARVNLALAATPAKAAKLTLAQLRAALKRSVRTRAFDTEAERLRDIFRAEYAHQLPAVEDALGHQLPALLKRLDAACQAAEAVEQPFASTPTARSCSASPDWPLIGARFLAEPGEDQALFADARALKPYAGSAPITRASGKKHFVGRGFIKNNRLMNAGFLCASAALAASPGANAHYRRRREHGDWHNAAQRHLLNRFLGQHHHCLRTRQPFDEQRAFAPIRQVPA